MVNVTKYVPKMVHCDFNNVKDLMGKPQPKIQVLRSILNPKTKDSVCFTIRPKIENNNKSAVGECIYQLTIDPETYNVGVLHAICQDALFWFHGEMNNRLKMPFFRNEYNAEEMNATLLEMVQTPLE